MSNEVGDGRMEPEPASDWPEGSLTESEARDLQFDRAAVVAVWVLDQDEATRTALLGPDPPDDAVVDIVLETDEAFEMYSYTPHDGTTQWVTYGEERKGTESGATMRDTLTSYRLLVGDSDLQ
ncbi:hypothetical protein ACFPYI_02815 [Halomarina salina]|uniref:Uncharacterized protein n=1 Tax=Halomarina salina TaxID=1872699 RepID=A0ABD5RIS0_9EURY|nr:hypothetical protein [Halomarina salina]